MFPIDPVPVTVNGGVSSDLRIALLNSGEFWRVITFRTRRGRTIEYLTIDFALAPGMVAFLYARR